MKVFFSFLISSLFLQFNVFCQSKKDQIQVLNLRVDSLFTELSKNQILNKEKAALISERNQTIDSLKMQIVDINNSMSQLKSSYFELKKEEEKLKKLNFTLNRKIDSLQTIISKPKNYLDKLPKGFKMTGPNGEEGERCSYDLDGDGILDLVVLLFSEEDSQGLVTIYLSKNFYSNNEFQYFEWMWISNTLGELNCSNRMIKINGGSTSDDISVGDEVNLSYSSQQNKMVVNFANREMYKLDKLIESESINDLDLKSGVIE